MTGIVLGSDGKPYVGRSLKRRIRSQIHNLDSLDPAGRVSLSGLVSYVGGFDSDFINSLIKKYGFHIIQRVRSATD